MKTKRFNEAAAAYRESGRLDVKRAEIEAQKEKASANEAVRMSMDEITDNPSVAGGDTSLYTKEAKAKETSAVRASELKERLEAKRVRGRHRMQYKSSPIPQSRYRAASHL